MLTELKNCKKVSSKFSSNGLQLLIVDRVLRNDSGYLNIEMTAVT